MKQIPRRNYRPDQSIAKREHQKDFMKIVTERIPTKGQRPNDFVTINRLRPNSAEQIRFSCDSYGQHKFERKRGYCGFGNRRQGQFRRAHAGKQSS
jgi:low affinity Fe/Cu permease